MILYVCSSEMHEKMCGEPGVVNLKMLSSNNNYNIKYITKRKIITVEYENDDLN